MADAVVCRWEGEPGWSRDLRVLPDGCVDLVWDGQDVLVVPPAPHSVRHPVRRGQVSEGIRLRPGWAASVLGVPVGELDGVTPLANIQRRPTSLSRLIADAQPDREVLAAVARLHDPRVEVRAVARDVGLSTRQLARRFRDHVGLSPKALQTVLRFHRFHRTVTHRRTPLAHVAADCGYWDQSHLTRDCHRIAGAAPSALRPR